MAIQGPPVIDVAVAVPPATDPPGGNPMPHIVGAVRRWPATATIRTAPVTRAQLLLGLQAAVAPFFVSRLLVWAATWFGARNIPATPGMYSNLYPPPALSPFFHWDADAYGYIAHHGYALGAGGVDAELARVAWFPFYPLLIRLAGGSDWAMIIIPNVCFFAALALLYVVALKRMDADRARLTVWLMALGPAAMFFSYPYTESVFLLLTVGAFLLMESGHWLLAGVAGGGGGGARFPPGVLAFGRRGAGGAGGPRRRAGG